MSGDEVDGPLAELAAAYGVATAYDDWKGDRVVVDRDVVVEVLGALGVDAADPATALDALQRERAARLVTPTVVATAGETRPLELGAAEGSVRVVCEDGATRDWSFGEGRGRAVPNDLPPGWHTLTVTAGGRTAEATLIVATVCFDPPAQRLWGWQVQLYALRSHGSWGLGDFHDLATIARWSAGQGAGALLVNPLHAMTPTLPLEVSPYFPSSRRFRSPLYLRVEDTPEYAAAPADVRAAVDAIAVRARASNHSERLDRDAVWVAKREALELLFPLSRGGERSATLERFASGRGDGLRDFATYCALAERHGPVWQDWPEPLRRPDAPAVAQARADLAETIAFHAWLQLLCDEQLAAAQAAAVDGGMPIGVIHDLAVGVDPGGADAWALQDALAVTTTVGAPPDSFNQQGQDWRLPPWRPDRLAALGYRPIRDMLQAVLRHAGGVRIDHILGLFRLYWVPAGEPASRGSYVRYDDQALLAALVLEAHRAGALVVGEDLGTVEPRVAETLRRLGVLGSDVLWFARGWDGPLEPPDYRALAAASVTTHDLPTTAGFLAGEHVRVRAELGVLGRPVEDERAQAERERQELVDMTRRHGLLGDDPSIDDVVVAFHALLARTPARLVLAYAGDAVGDLRQPNLPGTGRDYPSWLLPLADGEGRPVLVEDVMAAPLAARLAEALTRSRS